MSRLSKARVKQLKSAKGTRTASACPLQKVPCPHSQLIVKQPAVSPFTQLMHIPQEMLKGKTTRSPDFNCETPSPMESITPNGHHTCEDRFRRSPRMSRAQLHRGDV